jgi:hypothetical protein
MLMMAWLQIENHHTRCWLAVGSASLPTGPHVRPTISAGQNVVRMLGPPWLKPHRGWGRWATCECLWVWGPADGRDDVTLLPSRDGAQVTQEVDDGHQDPEDHQCLPQPDGAPLSPKLGGLIPNGKRSRAYSANASTSALGPTHSKPQFCVTSLVY